MFLMRLLLSLFFRLLYHPFAWTYDLVAALVSLGRWQGWVRCALPYLDGRVLELGHGPGHLQVDLQKHAVNAFGLDESRQMGRQAGRRLRRQDLDLRLARGQAGSLPFKNNCFDSVVATFPSEYIYDIQTLRETRRVLVPGGRLVIIPAAWITGQDPLSRLAAWLFRVTGQAGAIEAVWAAARNRLVQFGFVVHHDLVELPGSRVLVVIAENRNVDRT